MMKPESKPIAESKRKQDPRTESKRFIGRVQNLNLTFILIYHAHILLVNVYSNIYLDRFYRKKSIITITAATKARSPHRNQAYSIVYRQNSGDNHRLIFLIFLLIHCV